MSLLALFLSLFAAVGPALTVRPTDQGVRILDLYGADRWVPAALECRPGGEPVLYVSPGADLATLVHELAHAHDCADDGELNASPIRGARPEVRPAWASDYCWNTDAEWYACWVVHSRGFDDPSAPERDTPSSSMVSLALRSLLGVSTRALPQD